METETLTGQPNLTRWDFSSSLFFGTTTHLTLFGAASQGRSATHAWRAVERLFRRIEDDASTTRPDGPVARYNRAPVGEPVLLDGHAAQLFRAAEVVHDLSDGAYDPTVGPLVGLWGFSARQRNAGDGDVPIPDRTSVEQVRRLVGPETFCATDRGDRGIELVKTAFGEPSESAVGVPATSPSLDFGGIAKGYAVDGALAILRETGLVQGVLNCGGSGLALLANPHDTSGLWSVPVQDPLQPRDAPCLRLRVRDTVVTTSADYQHVRMVGNRRASHIIDPLTGYPAGWDAPQGAPRVACAVIVGEPACAADALATALCALRPERALAFVRQTWFSQAYRYAIIVAQATPDEVGPRSRLSCSTNMAPGEFSLRHDIEHMPDDSL